MNQIKLEQLNFQAKQPVKTINKENLCKKKERNFEKQKWTCLVSKGAW